MNRSLRNFLVVGISVVMAGLASFLVYRTIRNLPVREVEVAKVFAVVAAQPLTLGTLVGAADVKLVPWPASAPVPDSFATIEEVTGRGVISPISENEPLTANNLGGAGAGAGLPPTIPAGMRAISVRVNEVIGVAGFVVPGTRVDVMVIINQESGSVARVVVSNVQVLAAGTKFDQDVAKDGQAIPSSVVTLMVTPEDAERIGLASTEGQILLTLRNPLDTVATNSPGTRTPSLLGTPEAPKPSTTPAPAPVRRVVAPPPAAPAPPPVYTVETIRGAKRAEETVR